MPKETFHNLPAAKRQAIIDLAIEEFAERPYGVASLSHIVERAGIAKGSMYQYFEHKQELYLFVLEYAAREQLRLLGEQTPPEPDLDLFALLRWQMRAAVQVGLRAPQLTRLMYRATTDALPFRDEVALRLQAASEGYLSVRLAQAAARDEIDPTLDLELAGFMLSQLTSGLHELLLRRAGISLEAAAADPALLDNPATDALYDQVIRILQFGLAGRR